MALRLLFRALVIVLSLPPAAVSAPVYGSGGAPVGSGVAGSGASPQATSAAPAGSDSFTDIIQRIASPASPSGTAAPNATARLLTGGKGTTLTFALPVAALPSPPSPKMAPATATRSASVRTTPATEDASEENSDSTGGEADSKSAVIAPAAPGLPVSTVPVLPIADVTSLSVAALPQVPVAATAAPPIVQDDVPVALTPVKSVTDKDPSGKQSTVPASNVPQVRTGAPQTTMLPIPIDFTVPQTNVRPRLNDPSEASSPQPVEGAAQPATSSASQPEAAVNVVIQTNSGTSQGTQLTAPMDVPQQVPIPVIGPIVPAAVVIPSASGEPDRKKIELPSGIASSTDPQQMAVADAQVKAETARAGQNAETKAEAPRPASAAQEPVAPEKAQSTQLKSLSLEFTPDGARDVRVRIAERAGEVHVSLHSSDPDVARDLRSGAADLGSTLTQAGYDAQTWTSERQQQNPQQQRDEQQQRRGNESRPAENFDGLMTESTETL